MHNEMKRQPALSAQTSLNRRSEKRPDVAFLSVARVHPHAKVLLCADLRIPIISNADRSSATINWLGINDLPVPCAELAYLGEDSEGAPIFAGNLPEAVCVTQKDVLETYKPWVDLRSVAVQGVLSEDELQIAAQARGLLAWHSKNRCCSRCGANTQFSDGGWRRACTACFMDVYPRTDPPVIMLITYRGAEENFCLLGHEHRFPEKLYSTLAGFVEAGDDIETAVRREIREEAGIPVGAVHYVASQSWPFPHQLMIGCWGEALSMQLTIEPSELADARWFTRSDILSMMAFSHMEGLVVPPPISMAHTLLKAFVDGALV